MLEEIDRALDATCGKEETPARDAGRVLLVSAHVGGDAAKVAEALGWDVSRVEPFAKRLRKNGVWTKDAKVSANWFDEEEGGIAFACDVNVALGFMGRAR